MHGCMYLFIIFCLDLLDLHLSFHERDEHKEQNFGIFHFFQSRRKNLRRRRAGPGGTQELRFQFPDQDASRYDHMMERNSLQW